VGAVHAGEVETRSVLSRPAHGSSACAISRFFVMIPTFDRTLDSKGTI
jgi:hypothetical protein